jgi:hypothetical protein
MVVSHKVSGARLLRKFHEKLSIGADRLKSVVLYDNRFARQIREEKGHKRGTCDMKKVRFPNQLPQVTERGAANDRKWKATIVEASAGSLGSQSYFDSSVGRLRREFRQTSRQGQDDGLDTTDAWGEEMRIEQQFHDEYFRSNTMHGALRAELSNIRLMRIYGFADCTTAERATRLERDTVCTTASMSAAALT